jgi:uncharacterized protein YjbI with pentapeptide repeats
MRVVKPQALGFLQRSLEVRGKFVCSFGVPLLFQFGNEPKLLPEVELWKFLAAELDPETQFDLGVPKSHGEYLVIGDAFAPEGKPITACHVRVRLGTLEKLLFVSGDRRWVNGVPSQPVPFLSLPIRWNQAYGGPAFPSNPVGKGHRPLERDGVPWHALPNVEDPRRPMRTLSDQPLPASFAPLDPSWAAHARKRGTYDRAWLETRFPGLADDFDWSFFNVSAPDQRQDGAFRGDEPLSLENMHPSQPSQRGQLPAVQGRCFVRRHTADAELEPVELRLDTVWLFPKHERGVVVFHGMLEVSEDDARDVFEVVLAAEALGAPKSLDHYRENLRLRLDPEEGQLASLDDGPLMPEWFIAPKTPDPQPSPVEERLQEAAAERVALARATVESHGLDADEHAASWPGIVPVSLEGLPTTIREAIERSERARVEEERNKQKKLEAVKTLVEESGVSWEMIKEEFSPDAPGGPPQFSAQAELDRLQQLADECRVTGFDISELDDYLADQQLRGRLFEAERAMQDGYRRSAHRRNPARTPSAEQSATLRNLVVEAHGRNESMAGWDLTGVDLSGVSLRSAKLEGAFLEGAKLGGADLTEADLSHAVFARADLTRAFLCGANLRGTNFGNADLRGANLGPKHPDGAGCDATGAIFNGADLTSADLRRITLAEADLTDCKLQKANLSEAALSEITFSNSDLSEVCFSRARLHKANLLETTLDQTDFSDADLSLTSFVTSKGKGTKFSGANLKKASFVLDCLFPEADFRGADLRGALLRQVELDRSNFSGATADGADFSEAKLDDAVFFRSSAVEARFTRASLARTNFTSANLMGADFQKSRALASNFSRSNLFRADFGRTRFDRATSFESALLNQTKVLPRANNGS